MIKLKDLLEDTMPRGLSLSKLQVFSPGTGGDMSKYGLRLQPNKIPTGKLKITNILGCLNKPNGAFWTSSYKSRYKGSEWTDWKKKQMSHWRSGIGAVFEIQGSPKIARVSNWKQYQKLREKYPNDYRHMGCREGDQYLNWHELAKHYDGYHFAMSGKGPIGHLDWDVESVAWFNMSQLNFVGTIKT